MPPSCWLYSPSARQSWLTTVFNAGAEDTNAELRKRIKCSLMNIFGPKAVFYNVTWEIPEPPVRTGTSIGGIAGPAACKNIRRTPCGLVACLSPNCSNHCCPTAIEHSASLQTTVAHHHFSSAIKAQSAYHVLQISFVRDNGVKQVSRDFCYYSRRVVALPDHCFCGFMKIKYVLI